MMLTNIDLLRKIAIPDSGLAFSRAHKQHGDPMARRPVTETRLFLLRIGLVWVVLELLGDSGVTPRASGSPGAGRAPRSAGWVYPGRLGSR
jgi:hypothetical protein